MQNCDTSRAKPAGLPRLRRRAWLGVLALFIALLCAPAPVGGSDAAAMLEYKLKAGYLFNFAKFVEWPTNVVPAANSPMIVGVLADDPAAPVIEQHLQGKIAGGHPLTVKLLPNLSGLPDCQMFFISRSQQENTDKLLANLQAAPVLVIGEVDQFAHRGGMINFVRKDESFRLEVNLEAAEKAGLKVSSKLASIGTIVKTRK
jgi:YfiR/HmsC-like